MESCPPENSTSAWSWRGRARQGIGFVSIMLSLCPIAVPMISIMTIDLTESEIHRYSRHILLPEMGATGQGRLKAARVLVVGAGGLGSPLLLYLAAAGVGTIGVIDDDRVELSNLQRQIAHSTDRIGMLKVDSARQAAEAINPEIRIETHVGRLDESNAASLISAYDLVCDGSDNFQTRFIVADAALHARRTLVSAAVLRFEGQLSTFRPHLDPEGPCYRCLTPEIPPRGAVPSCAEAGILGAVTGVLGSLQATEVIKELCGMGESLSGRLLIWEALAGRFRTIRLPRDPHCPSCGGLHGRG
ncbi:Molybdopterin biosynthesis MoeB protein [Granulibacter bethesdensis]|nr:Molybdopterin biosynthesis MoeB protein [Granulibacter bethesdensis]